MRRDSFVFVSVLALAACEEPVGVCIHERGNGYCEPSEGSPCSPDDGNFREVESCEAAGFPFECDTQAQAGGRGAPMTGTFWFAEPTCSTGI